MADQLDVEHHLMTTGDDNPRPWEAERTIEEELARALIEEQFPDLAPIRKDRE